jgi:hypothetical protein
VDKSVRLVVIAAFIIQAIVGFVLLRYGGQP